MLCERALTAYRPAAAARGELGALARRTSGGLVIEVQDYPADPTRPRRHGFIVAATLGSRKIGELRVLRSGGRVLFVAGVHVDDDYTRQGVATALYERASVLACEGGFVLESGSFRSLPADAFWRKQQARGRARWIARRRSFRLPCPPPTSLEGLSRPAGWGIAGAAALLLGALAGGRAWRLVRNAYGSVEDWAADRGRQVREFFHIQIGRLRPFGDVRPQDFTADAWNGEKLSTIHPRFRSRFASFVSAAQSIARSHGREILVWQAVRPLENQIDYLRSGTSRTIASRHLVGLAIDLAMRGEEGGYDGPCEDDCSQRRWPAWYEDEVVPAGKRLGLVWGGDWQGFRDTPHFEVPEREWPSAVAVALQSLREDYPG